MILRYSLIKLINLAKINIIIIIIIIISNWSDTTWTKSINKQIFISFISLIWLTPLKFCSSAFQKIVMMIRIIFFSLFIFNLRFVKTSDDETEHSTNCELFGESFENLKDVEYLNFNRFKYAKGISIGFFTIYWNDKNIIFCSLDNQPQLQCDQSTNTIDHLCDDHAVENVKCRNLNYQIHSTADWSCDFKMDNEIIEIETFEIHYEPTNLNTSCINKSSSHLIYSLRNIDKSNDDIEFNWAYVLIPILSILAIVTFFAIIAYAFYALY